MTHGGLPLPAVCSRVEAEASAGEFAAVISLAGTAAGRGELRGHQRRLFCPFDDVIEDERTAAGPDHIRRILDFVVQEERLLVHCEYGQSRSVAVALGVAVSWGWDPEQAVHVVLRAHPPQRPFVPNERVLRLFDEVLSCKGILLRAGLAHTRI